MTYRDRMTYNGAWATANDIVQWWRQRGHRVNAWVEPIPCREGGNYSNPIYVVRSDLVNGAPRPMSMVRSV